MKINEKNKKLACVIFDLDGTIYRGEKEIPGAVDFVTKLMAKGIAVLFYTNRAYRTPFQIAEKLNGLNFPVSVEQVITSAVVTADALSGKRVFCIGSPALFEALRAKEVVTTEDNPDYVVVGYTDILDSMELTKAVQFISHEKAVFVATNLDPYILVDGKRVVENGVIVAAVQAATGRTPLVCGKPDPYGINMVLKKYGLLRENVLMVGDSLSTDIQCGINAQIRNALILTGVSSAKDALDSRTEIVVKDYGQLWIKLFGSQD